MPVTIPQTETILKSYFQTGDKPTQDQFEELIGTMFYLYQDAKNTANAAVVTADAAEDRAPKALASAVHPGSGTTYTLEYQYNVASIVTLTGPSRVKVTFTNAMPSVNYVAILVPLTATAFPDQIQLISRTTGYCEFAVYDGATFLSQVRLMFAAFEG